MTKLDQAREIIARALKGAKFPIVLWSGGKDSQLILKLVNDIRETPALWFRSVDPKRNKFAERFIADSNLTAYSWEPADRYLLPNGNEFSLVEEFSFGHRKIPVISDIAQGERCAINISKQRVSFVNYDFDVTFAGVKAVDRHPIAPHAPEGFVYPLWHMSDEDVWESIRELEIPVEESVYDGREPDGPALCTNCLSQGEGEVYCPEKKGMIPRFSWQPDAALAAFNRRFARAA